MKLRKKNKFQIGGSLPDWGPITVGVFNISTPQQASSEQQVQKPAEQPDYNLWPIKGTKEEYLRLAKSKYGTWNSDTQQTNNDFQRDFPQDNSYREFFSKDYTDRARQRHPNVTLQKVNDILDTVPVISEYGPKNIGGTYDPKYGGIRLNKNALNWNPTLFAHELGHAFDYRLNLSGDESRNRDLYNLKLAYRLIPDDREKRAVNTQLRYQLFLNSGRKTGKELDTYIDQLSIDNLRNVIKQLNTDYINERDINGGNVDSIKEALKYVASIQPTEFNNSLVGLAKLGKKL